MSFWYHYCMVNRNSLRGEKMELDGLHEWREQLLLEIENNDTLIRELRCQRGKTYRQLKYVNALLGIATTTGEPNRIRERTKYSTAFLDACERILRASPEPMHVKDLMQRLCDDGVTLPGAGTIANLISRVWRSPRFKRVAPGTYTTV